MATQEISKRDIGSDVFICPDKGEEHRFPVLFESDKFKIKLGKGALTAGYLMLVPKREVSSFAELDPTEMQEFQKILPKVNKIFHDTYGQVPTIWENGSAYENAGGIFANSIDHAHLHILPVAPTGQMVDKINRDRNLQSIDIFSPEFEKFKDNYYLLFGDPKGDMFISQTKDPERQYVRKLFAHVLQTPNAWNWREFANDENVQLGKQQLTEAFAKLQKAFELAKGKELERLG